MSKFKIYAVKKGKEPGIYMTWGECKAQVNGYKGAEYKSFSSLDEAERYLGLIPVNERSVNQPFLQFADNTKKSGINNTELHIYVDGSYDISTQRFSYGMVVVSGGNVIETSSNVYNDPSFASMRNVTGEIMGAMTAMQYCQDNRIDEVVIYYDYDGIAKWPLREWKTNKDGTRMYVSYYDKMKQNINIQFKHIKSHSGDKYNEMADKLAREAIGL